jgi:hypothetical protein
MASSKYRSKILEIYAASEDEAKKIREAAKRTDQTISKYVLNVLRPHLYEVEEKTLPSHLVEEANQLKDENRRLREEGRSRDILLERYEAELRRTRDAAFLAPHGDAALDPELLNILRKGPIHEYKLLEALRIAESDTAAIRSISRQLALLESSCLIAKGPNGWRWLG